MDSQRYRVAEQGLWSALGLAPTERMLALERTRATVRVQVVGEGPPVVFLHGANTSGSSWAPLAAGLDGFRRIVVDRPGTGLSPAPPTAIDERTLEGFADGFTPDLLDALGLERASLVATSFGGYLALRGAAAVPDRIERMVQFSWPAGAPTSGLPWFMRLSSVPGLGRLMASLPATERTVRMTFRRIGHGPSLDDGRITGLDVSTYLALLRHTDTMRNELAMGRALISPIRGLTGIRLDDAVLARVTAPTLFVWGGRDPFGGESTAREVVRRMPNATLELLPAAGHAPWLDDLDACVRETATFLRG